MLKLNMFLLTIQSYANIKHSKIGCRFVINLTNLSHFPIGTDTV